MNFTLNKNQNWETSATVLKKKAIADEQVTEDNIANYQNTGKEITREDSATQVVFHNKLNSKNITVQKIWHDNITDHSGDYVEFKLEGKKSMVLLGKNLVRTILMKIPPVMLNGHV